MWENDMIAKKAAGVLVLVALVFVVGCAAPKATYRSPSFDPQTIDRIVVLPCLDNRVKPDPDNDWDEVCGVTETILFSDLKFTKGYRVVWSSDIGSVPRYSVGDMPRPDSQSKDTDSVDPSSVDSSWVKGLGPETDRWILVPVIDNLVFQNIIVNVSTSAKMSIYLFDKEAGEIAWKGVGSSAMSTGILTAGLMGRSTMEETALWGACVQGLASFDEKTTPNVLPD